MCPIPVRPRVLFLFGHMSFLGLPMCSFPVCPRAIFYLPMGHLHVWPNDVFLFVHVYFPSLATCCFPVCQPIHSRFLHMLLSCLPVCQFTICTRVHFLLGHASISCSPTCPFWTATCPFLDVKCVHILHVDIQTDPFHHRTTNVTALLFLESTPKLQPNKFMRPP
jgi:hypothetical protein